MKKILFAGLLLLTIFGCGEEKEKLWVFLAGDSTVANKPYREGNPEKGWGQVLPLYFNDGVVVDNHAVNGRSTKSFIDEGKWDSLISMVKPGDYVFIEFGHNDAKISDSTRYAAADGAYSDNLRRFVADIRAKEATPVLLSPIMRRRFDDKGVFYDTHGGYPDAVRSVADELDVVLIDLHKSTQTMLVSFGEEASKKLFLHVDTNEYAHLDKPIIDDTHLSAYGAFKVADMLAAAIKRELPELAAYLKE